MEPLTINYWAVVVAGLAYTILGAVWYSTALFGNVWMAGIGKSKEQVQADFSALNIFWAFVGSCIAAYGLARVMIWSGEMSIGRGIMVSLVAGVCFVFVAMGVNDLFEKRPMQLFFINVLYHLISFVAMGIILGVWQ